MDVVEDPRAQREGICGVTTMGATGIEWICIKPAHAKIYTRRSGDRTHKKGEVIFSDSPQADQHYFVNRYPYRNQE